MGIKENVFHFVIHASHEQSLKKKDSIKEKNKENREKEKKRDKIHTSEWCSGKQ